MTGEGLLFLLGERACLASRAGGSAPRWYRPSRLSSSRYGLRSSSRWRGEKPPRRGEAWPRSRQAPSRAAGDLERLRYMPLGGLRLRRRGPARELPGTYESWFAVWAEPRGGKLSRGGGERRAGW
jgi:hypothetical protein